MCTHYFPSILLSTSCSCIKTAMWIRVFSRWSDMSPTCGSTAGCGHPIGIRFTAKPSISTMTWRGGTTGWIPEPVVAIWIYTSWHHCSTQRPTSWSCNWCWCKKVDFIDISADATLDSRAVLILTGPSMRVAASPSRSCCDYVRTSMLLACD